MLISHTAMRIIDDDGTGDGDSRDFPYLKKENYFLRLSWLIMEAHVEVSLHVFKILSQSPQKSASKFTEMLNTMWKGV